MKIESRQTRMVLASIVIAGGLILTVFVIVFQFLHYSGYRVCLDDYPEVQEEYQYDIAIKSKNYKYYDVSGWILVTGREVKQYRTSLVLYTEDGDAVAVPTKMVDSTELTEGLDDIHDYKNRQFRVRLRKSLTEDQEYYIGFLVDVERTECLIKTGQRFKYIEEP